MIVLLSTPADLSQRDKVEKINSIGSPDEKPKNNSLKTLMSEYILNKIRILEKVLSNIFPLK